MEIAGRSDRFEPHTMTVKLPPQVAEAGVRAAMFSEFYRGVASGDVTFQNGTISGHIDQPAVAPFPAHSQEFSGTYSADRFELRVAMPPIGDVQSCQRVKGRLAKPA